MIKYIKTHWYGKYSLVESYWLNSMIAATIAVLVVSFFAGMLIGLSAWVASAALPGKAAMNFIGAIISLPIVTWSLVGTWRSADEYIKSKPIEKVTWGHVAKIAICLGVLKTAVTVISTFMLLF